MTQHINLLLETMWEWGAGGEGGEGTLVCWVTDYDWLVERPKLREYESLGTGQRSLMHTQNEMFCLNGLH